MGRDGRTHPIRVVIADDFDINRHLVRRVLERAGRFEVVGEASDGRQAVEIVRSTHPDAVMLDVEMPLMDGLQALPLIRRESPQSRIVVLSGLPASAAAERALNAGADAFLPKGCHPSEIVSALLQGDPDTLQPVAQAL